MAHRYFDRPGDPRVFAHRGLVTPELAEQGILENTLAAFEAAVAAGAHYLESDGQLTSDGVVVLFHDTDLRRVLGDERRVSEVTHAELAAMMRDRGGLLTLNEALERFSEEHFNLDVKVAAAAEAMGTAVAAHADRVLLASFNERARVAALAAAERAGAQPATSPSRRALLRILAAAASRSPAAARRALTGIDALQIPERYGAIRVLSPALIAAAHREQVEVHVWTVNDPARMRELVAMGVDGIITDRSDLAVQHLR